MLSPKTYEELATHLTKIGKHVLFFTADWCPDCQFIYPVLPEIETIFSQFQFIRVDRDLFIDLAQQWDVFGIPSLVVIADEKEIGRFVSKKRKSKSEIIAFLSSIAEENT